MNKDEAFIVVNQEKLRIKRQIKEAKMELKTKNEMIITMQKCKTCNKLKPPKDFYSTNKSVCKDCLKERTVQWHKNNLQGLRKIQARTRAQPGYKEKQAKLFKKWYEKRKGEKVCPTCQRRLG